VINECSDTSLRSAVHGTIFLEVFKGGNNSRNLIWNHYAGAEVETYAILRGTSEGGLSELDLLPGILNNYSDPNPPSGPLYYQIRALLLAEGSVNGQSQYKSYSNIASLVTTEGPNLQISQGAVFYPNPVTSALFIDFPNPGADIFTCTLSDLSGRVIRSYGGITGNKFMLQRSGLPSGAYILELTGPGAVYKARIILE
jgi:hypothetical protein